MVARLFFCEKKNGFLSHSGHKIAAAIVSDFWRGGFGCDGGGGGYGFTILMVEAV